MIFDSDALIWLGRGDARVRSLFDADAGPALSTVTLIELFQGSRTALELATIRNFVRKLNLRLLPVNDAISYRAVALVGKHAPGDGVQLADALIAATVIEYDETLVTGNVRHLRLVCGMKIKPLRHSGIHQPRLPRPLIQIEFPRLPAKLRIFLRLLQQFIEFPVQHLALILLCFERFAEHLIAPARLALQLGHSGAQIPDRRWFYGFLVGYHHAQIAIYLQLRLTAGALYFKKFTSHADYLNAAVRPDVSKGLLSPSHRSPQTEYGQWRLALRGWNCVTSGGDGKDGIRGGEAGSNARTTISATVDAHAARQEGNLVSGVGKPCTAVVTMRSRRSPAFRRSSSSWNSSWLARMISRSVGISDGFRVGITPARAASSPDTHCLSSILR
jgi:predicted nucleic acid-binding protein